MSKYNRYVFRLYSSLGNGEGVYGHPDNDGSQQYLASPYMDGYNNIDLLKYRRYKPGQIIRERHNPINYRPDSYNITREMDRDMLNMSVISDAFKTKNGYEYKKMFKHRNSLPDKGGRFYDTYSHKWFAPHRGISVIGLADPRYSLYNVNRLHTPLVHNMRDGDVIYNTTLERLMPNDVFINNYNNVADGLHDILYGKGDFGVAYDSGFDNDVGEDGNSVNGSGIRKMQDYFREGVQKAFPGKKIDRGVDLLQAMIDDAVANKRYYKNNPNYLQLSKGDDVQYDFLLGNALEKAWATSGVKGGHRYRLIDIPDEAMKDLSFDNSTGYYRLLNAISETAGNQLWLGSVPEDAIYPVSDVKAGRMRGQRDFPEELVVNRLKLVRPLNRVNPQDVLYETNADTTWKDKLNEDLAKMRSKVGYQNNYERIISDLDKEAEDYIYKNFEIDPTQIVSDETKKYIYDDLSKWYNDTNRRDNVLRGVKEFGQ